MVISFSSATSSVCRVGLMVRHSKYSRRVLRLQLFHAPTTAVEQQAQFVIGMEDAGYLVNQVTDAHQFGIGRPVGSAGKLQRCRCHAEAFRIAIAEAGTRFACKGSPTHTVCSQRKNLRRLLERATISSSANEKATLACKKRAPKRNALRVELRGLRQRALTVWNRRLGCCPQCAR